MKKSQLFIELERMFHRIKIQGYSFPKTESKNQDLFEIFLSEKPNYNSAKKLFSNENVLSNKLNKLKEALILEHSEYLFKRKYNKIFNAEALFDLGLLERGREALNEAWEVVEDLDYWQRWHLIELETQNHSAIEKGIGFNKQYLISIRSIAKMLETNDETLFYESLIGIEQTDLLKLLEFLKKKNTLNFYFDQIELAKSAGWYMYYDESDSKSQLKIIENHFQINSVFELSFQLILFLIENIEVIDFSNELIQKTLKLINEFCQTIRLNTENFAPNLLSFYFINRSRLLSSSVFLLPYNDAEDNYNEIHPEIYFDKEDFRNNTFALDVLIDIFCCDTFENRLGSFHIDLLESAFYKIHDITNGNKSVIFKPDAELGFKCIYILLRRILNKSGRNFENSDYIYRDLIEREAMTETRFKDCLSNIDFYKDILDFEKPLTNLRPKDLLQLCSIKLRKFYKT
jgi:hypothetical protein